MFTIREITKNMEVIDIPEYYRDIETAIYNAKEFRKDSKKSMFFIIDDCDNVMDENGRSLINGDGYDVLLYQAYEEITR